MPEKDKTYILDVPDMLMIETFHVKYTTYGVAFALMLLVWVGIHFDCGGLLEEYCASVRFCFCFLKLEKRTVCKECMTSLGMLPATSV